ncbi:MAG: hypothetical protein ACI8UO_005413 [Verrucomicrobiales bacterium]|jgi:hypothetical protein
MNHLITAVTLAITPVADDPTKVVVEATGVEGTDSMLTLRLVIEDQELLSPAMFGTTKMDGEDTIRFTPAVRLSRGKTYQAKLSPGKGAPVFADYSVPKLDAPTPKLTRIFPTAQQLPANLLKFYLYFDQPMREGRAIFDQFHIENDAGERVHAPWRRQEIWNEDARRLTLWIHPGRIKRGVNLREEFGPVLLPDREYTLVIDKAVRSADGEPLAEDIRHKFKTIAEDHERPLPETWTLTLPKAGTREPLRIKSPEPLDHALIWIKTSILDPDGKPISAKIDVDEGESSWFIEPVEPWAAGEHQLRIDGTLEDLAGNTPIRVFDNDLTLPQVEPAAESIPFTPKPKS